MTTNDFTRASLIFNDVELDAASSQHWKIFCDKLTEPQLAKYQELALDKLELLQKGFGLSEFIFRVSCQFPQLIFDVLADDKNMQARAEHFQSTLHELLSDCQSEEQLHKVLRQFRAQQMAAIALRDLCLDCPIEQSLKDQSALADALILNALAWLSKNCQPMWGTPVNASGEEQPMLVYGMGKLGGGELNFSSDIDLIFTYPEKGETQGGRRTLDNQQYFTRLGQKLIAALHQVTADGFVFRVDMRLRPFGDSGPLVMSFSALEDYYQEQGRDWERYAMLKARPIGSGDYHAQLTQMLRPFVYRRYIDFSVIESLRKMKAMIQQEVRRKQLSGNIKLGAGGIREVEFIVQVFQLIRGGRETDLQERSLLTVLPKLVKSGALIEKSEHILTDAYLFLRRCENILQAMNDQQTQALPQTSLEQARLVYIVKQRFDIDSWQDFLALCEQKMQGVHQEFGVLIGEESPHNVETAGHWQLLWESEFDESEAKDWIAQHQPNWQSGDVWRHLNDFKLDVSKRSIGSRGRQVLDKLIPHLLTCFEAEADISETLQSVLHLVKRIMTRTAYLELLYENHGALLQLIKLCHSSQWIAEHLSHHPILLDELIDPKLLYNPPPLSAYSKEVKLSMLRIPEDDLEAQMEGLRQFKQTQQLRIAAADITGVLTVREVSDHLSALAEAIVEEVVSIAWQQMLVRFGQPSHTVGTNDKGFAVIGYGKLGGVELSYSSDLDVVFVHNAESHVMTTGAREIPASQFYLKLAQRVMHIFNTRTSSGILYEMDLRLRPSGNSGLLAVHINTYHQYLETDAWTWEHQALVRARMVCGQASMYERFKEIRTTILSLEREANALKKDVVEMREKMRSHLDKSNDLQFDLKQGHGGLADIEFMVQYLVLLNSANYSNLLESSDNISVLEKAQKLGLISADDCDDLISHYSWLRDAGHRLALQNESAKLSLESLQHSPDEVANIWRQCMLAEES